MKLSIVGKANVPSGLVEIYSDGDVVVTTRTRYGVVMTDLPYAVMKPLYDSLNLSPDDPPPIDPQVINKPTGKLKPPARIEKTPSGWKTNIRVGKEDRVYFYRTRDQARAAKPIHKVGGPEGRIK